MARENGGVGWGVKGGRRVGADASDTTSRRRQGVRYRGREVDIFVQLGDRDFDADFRQQQKIARHECRDGPSLSRPIAGDNLPDVRF